MHGTVGSRAMRLTAVGQFRAAAIPILALGLLAFGTFCAACGDSSKPDEASEVLAQLRSDAPADRYEAVVRLGLLPLSEARRDALARAVRDTDAKVRLLAGLVVVGDGPTEHATWLATPAPTRPTTGPNPARTPSPTRAADLSPIEQLVALDPWFAGTLKPGALGAAHDGDERVRVLGNRALRCVNPGASGR
jgi:hypothetical protein